ncbi:MAG: DUF5060 domain-containing protein [Pirellulaceae bacterium]|nr:DUF5060 domain-containing protein [Pirellulaceae bacterium]
MRIITGWLLVVLLLASFARAEDVIVPLWGRWEGRFEADTEPKSPLAVDFWLEFTTPTGQAIKALGFWDGERTWRCRWLPTEPGTWKYVAKSQPATAGLAGSGSFECRPAEAKPGTLPARGPLAIARSGTHFVQADGTPFFWLGDTVWNGPLLATKADWDEFLAARAARKFNVIQFNLLAPWRTAAADEVGQVAYTAGEKLAVHPRFFQRMDERIDAINAHGLIAAPVLLWTLGKREVSPGQLPDEQCVRLARYGLARYQGHHVAWILAGDENYAGDRGQRWAKIGRGGVRWPCARAGDDSPPRDELDSRHAPRRTVARFSGIPKRPRRRSAHAGLDS